MKPISIHGFKRRALRKNRKGGIEGLPLQLLIIIVVASLGLTMMVGWMNNIEEPTTISRIEVYADPTDSDYKKDFDVTVVVYDNKGNPVEGATVALTGLGATVNKPANTAGLLDDLLDIFGLGGDDEEETTTTTTTQNGGSESQGGTPFATTGSDGSVNLHVYLTGLRDYGYLNIEVSKTGYGTYTDRVPVAI